MYDFETYIHLLIELNCRYDDDDDDSDDDDVNNNYDVDRSKEGRGRW
jgi:hypothetical protein